MSEPELIEPSVLVAAHQAPRSLMSAIDAKYLEPVRLYRDLKPWLKFAWAGSVKRRLLDANNAGRDKADAHEWLSQMPQRNELSNAADAFAEAIERSATSSDVALIVGGLFNAHPNAQKMPVADYVEMLNLVLSVGIDLDDLDETTTVSATALAYGAVLAAGSGRFIPSIAEISEQTMKARSIFKGASARTRHLIDLRDSAEDVLIEVREFDAYRGHVSLFNEIGDDVLVPGLDACTLEKINGDMILVRRCSDGEQYLVRARDDGSLSLLRRLDASNRGGNEK